MLVIIPARGGSKRIPGKNIKLLNGKPLIQYSIDVAREVFSDEEIIVSTDSNEINNVVLNLGLKIPFLRPDDLATDTTGTREVLLHAINFMEKKGVKNDTLILLQPTSPFRTSEHIRGALKLYNSELEMLVSVKETNSNPYYNLQEENPSGFLEKSKGGNYSRLQDCPKVWELNGAIYIINITALKKKPISKFKKVKKYVMDEVSSHDIDTMWDWQLAEILIKMKLD